MEHRPGMRLHRDAVLRAQHLEIQRRHDRDAPTRRTPGARRPSARPGSGGCGWRCGSSRPTATAACARADAAGRRAAAGRRRRQADGRGSCAPLPRPAVRPPPCRRAQPPHRGRRVALALAGIVLVLLLDLRRIVEVVHHQPGALLAALSRRCRPAQFSRSIRAPFDRWKCATGSRARVAVGPRSADSARTAAAAPARQPRAHRARRATSRARASDRRPAPPRRSPAPACRRRGAQRRWPPPRVSRSGSSSASCASSQRRKPGIGDSVAKVLEVAEFGRQLVDHALDQEIAEADAGQPALAVADGIEDRGIGRRADPAPAPSRPAGAARCRPALAPAPPRRRSAARPACADGRRRSSGGRNRAGSSGRARRGCRAPPRSRPASPAAPPGCSSRSAAAPGSRHRTSSPAARCRSALQRRAAAGRRRIMPQQLGAQVDQELHAVRDRGELRQQPQPRRLQRPAQRGLGVGPLGRVGRLLHRVIGARRSRPGRHRSRRACAGSRGRPAASSAEIGLRQLGGAVARADLAAARRRGRRASASAMLLVRLASTPRHVAPDGGDAAQGAVEQAGVGDSS